MKIPMKIYYELSTGNVIQEIGEREGSVVETTLDQDFQSYASLSERVKSTVGVIQLTYGQYADKFGIYAYHIDLLTNEVTFDLTPIQIEAEVIIQSQAEKIVEFEANQSFIQEALDFLIMGGV